ncbi:MAG TPA: regulatory protein GemA [Devosia sp.]|nr:regulatory protein GemA [Devosia sp.]
MSTTVQSIRAIQAMKRELGLDEPDYRAMLERVTGQNSLRAMNGGQLGRVIEDMKSKGAGGKKKLDGPYGGKLQALWISGWNLGVVRNASNEALLGFVKGQTGIDHTRFLRNPADARKAVEALKGWLTREAGVDWSAFDDPQDCVLQAQCRLLRLSSADMGYNGGEATTALAKVSLMKVLGDRIRDQKAGA